MEFETAALPWQKIYKLLIGAIVPRPIGWISTLNAEGRPNLAPFSFFTAVCANPPTLLFCPMKRTTDESDKDTLRNIRATQEFVVNIATAALAENMNQTSTEFPAEVDEFAAAGLITAPSVRVRPPRVAASPVHFECRLGEIIKIGDSAGSGNIVIGEIVHIHVADETLLDGDKINLEQLQPVGRLAGDAYCHVREVFRMARPPSQIQPLEARKP